MLVTYVCIYVVVYICMYVPMYVSSGAVTACTTHVTEGESLRTSIVHSCISMAVQGRVYGLVESREGMHNI